MAQTQAVSSQAASSAYAPVPQTAPNGIRMFVHLPLRNESQLEQLVQQQSTEGSPEYHRWLTPAQFRASYGPRLADLENAALALRGAGFSTTITSQGIFADAPQAVVERTFQVHLTTAASTIRPGTPALVADRAPTLPAALTTLHAQVVMSVRSPHKFVPLVLRTSATPITDNRYSGVGPYWFDDLKQAYKWPSYTLGHGTGKTIAILAASDFLTSDYETYFAHEHLPSPVVIKRPVSGGAPPFDPNSAASFEVTADIQQAGGMAPGAELVVYGVSNSVDDLFISAYTAMDEDNIADVVSSSFGSCELFYTAAYNGGVDFTGLLRVYHDLFLQGNSQGITFIASSGDNGAKNCTTPDFKTAVLGIGPPASDPAVTAVGGTNLVTWHSATSLISSYIGENAYGDPLQPGGGQFGDSGAEWGSGGGKSVIWAKPSYQSLVNTHSSTRSIPDLALHMGGCPGSAIQPCPKARSADVVVFDGGGYGAIGTSLSAPDFAGLQALREQLTGSGREGNVNYIIYSLARGGTLGNGPIFHNNIAGNNGYPSTPGYNFVVGNGSIIGSQYVLRPFGPFAGIPQTPSNP